MTKDYRALVVRKANDNQYTRAIEICRVDDLPIGDVLIRVHFSSINYKDCLSCIGNPGVTRRYPHTPGIDASGIVETSNSNEFRPGDSVMVISHAMGMSISGGFGQYIRVPASWVMHLPEGLSLYESMIYGTAGYTAALSVEALIVNNLHSDSGAIVVTGATGGVGSMSVALLGNLGFNVTASSGKSDAEQFLCSIGALKVIDRAEVSDQTVRNLLIPTWKGAIDTVGGNTLSTLLKKCKDGGAVVATGLVESTHLSTTILPFILRGVKLVGIYAEGTDYSQREKIWCKMAGVWKPQVLQAMVTVYRLDDLPFAIDQRLAGVQKGRFVIDLRE